MKILSQVNKTVIKFLEYLLAVLLGIAVCFIIAQVFCRYVLGHPLDWTEQSSRFLFIWMMMLGAAIVFYRDSAMAFDMLLHAFPSKLQFWLEALIKLLIILFSLYYGYQAIVLASSVGHRMTSGVRIPLALMYSSMIVSNIFVVMVMVEKFIAHFISKDKEEQT